MTEEKQSYHDYAVRNDIIGLMQELVSRGNYTIRESDGKLQPNMQISPNTPWHHVAHLPGADCDVWHRIMFDIIGKQLPEKFVPSKCQECWKIVVRPKTIVQLFQLLEMQKRLRFPSKCGIELRDSVHGLYGGYFYNTSLQQGLDRFKIVRAEVDKELDKDVTVLLKRACTEFEHGVGDSKYWTVKEWQLPLEDLLNRYLVFDDVERSQPEHLIRHIHRKWIEFAYKNGDETYKHFTNGKPLFPAYRTYHHLIDASPEEIKNFWEEGEPRPET